MALISSLPQFPDTRISLRLFHNVSNASEIRSKVAQLPYAIIDARSICSLEQVYSAIYRALVESKYGKLKTKSLHSECLYSLSATSNIGEAYKNFGIKDDSQMLLVIQIVDKDQQDLQLQGDEVPLNDENLSQNCDMTFIRKIYKLNEFHSTSTIEISRAVVNCIQLRGL
ncbi:hypothetical protein ZYGR_0N05930 [Zygosaccharomyces rouxii]|nr:hypothetical protein ZYGR_0N05930 [Zygosaccharomyces rouxii]